MATISTSQTFDSAPRTAGEAFTINSGAVFTIDSDTRDGKNSAASRAGSMGAYTMTAATGGTCLIDGTKVWLIKYDGLQGSPNVPALGTTIRGVTSGATGELMNITSAINAIPTAAGAAMPATGYIKLKSKTGDFIDNEILEISGSTDLCTANGVGARGWIEVVVDDAASFTIGRAQKFQITGDWYVSETVGSGSAHQQVQFPNYGGANFFLAGCWVDEAANGTWEFWPACITGTGTFWSASHMGTDARNKFCECLGGGIIRFGGNGTTAWGKIPTAGAKFRIPNVLLKSAATASRSSDSIPNGTLATRLDSTTTNAGQVDIDGAIGHWQFNSGQAYSIRLHNLALFDQFTITECATALDFDNCHNGNHIIAQDAAALVLTSNFAGGTIANCKFGRTGTIASADYGINVQYCNGITFSNTFFANRTFRTNAGAHPFYAAYCGTLSFSSCVVVGASLYLLACTQTTINNLQYADSHHTTSSSTTPPVGVIQLIGGTANTIIDGFGWYTSVANVHPDTAILYLNAAYGVKVRNIGTYASPLSAGSSNAMLYFCNDAGNSQDLEFKRIYFNLIATTFFNAVNSTKNVQVTNCEGNTSAYKALTSAALNQIVKNSGITTITPASTASIYGSIFYHHFTSTSAGRLGLVFSEPTAEYSSYVTTNFTSSSSGNSGFNSSNGLALINSGDYAIFVYPFTIKGIDSFQNSAPTITTATNMTVEYQIDTGSGYGGTWKTFDASNLSAETVDEVTGFNFKIKCTANATNAANILTVLYCLTNSNTTAQAIQYPLDETLVNIVLDNIVVGSKYRIERQSDHYLLFEGTAASSPTTLQYTHTSNVPVNIIVRKSVDSESDPKYVPFSTQGTITNTGLSVFVAQVNDSICATSTNGTIGTDFSINTTTKTIRHTTGSTVYTVNQLYTWLMNYFDETSYLDDSVPMSAQTPTEYTLINGWFIDDESVKYLSGGAIQTSGWTSGTIRLKPYNASGAGTAFSASDIGRVITETDSGDTGTILFYDERTSAEIGYVWIRPDTAADTFADVNSTYSVASSSASGVFSAASTTGENIWSNIFTLGSLVSGTTLDIYQNDLQITPWWSSGHIDVLVKVKEMGVEIDSGKITVLARQYSTLYDHFLIDASTGRNPIPLASFTDNNNQTAVGTVGVAPYTNISFDFGYIGGNLGNGIKPYDVSINCATLTLTQVYEYLKYVTRSGSSTILNGVNGEFYTAVGDIRLNYSSESNGPFVEGNAITSSSGGSGYIVSLIDNGTTGTLVIRNTHGTFLDTNTLTSGATTATINGTPDTITAQKQAPFGSFAGGQFFGARGVWITNYAGSDSNNFTLIDSTGTTQTPPSTIAITVNGLLTGDQVGVYRTTGDNEIINKSVYTSHNSANTSGLGTFTTTSNIEPDTPSTGNLHVVNRDSSGNIISEQSYPYLSWTGQVFTLSGTLTQTYDSFDTAFVPYIDTDATATSISVSITYNSSHYLVTRVRKKGIVPFSVKSQLTNSDLTVTAIRTNDNIVS